VRTVKVPLAERSYDILIGPQLLKDLPKYCQSLQLGTRCSIITDSHVGPRYADDLKSSLHQAGYKPDVVTVRAGEKSKGIRTVDYCYDALSLHHLERRSFVIALGGGVVGDLAGFVAATYLRGIPFIQVPTTLLSQVDSSVGGKTGINLRAGKNLVGAFYQPRLVVCDSGTLRTLPRREYVAGIAEVIKYGIIYDASFFNYVEKNMPKILKRDPKILAFVVARCCEIKSEVVGQDETESGTRAILNFGHTIGHAIEAISGYGRYLHGEAISIGQVLATRLSKEVKGLAESDVSRITKVFAAAGLPTKAHISAPMQKRLFDAMRHDKKVSDGEIKFVLAKKIGAVEYGVKVPEETISQLLNS
jgi:3-dehydroquinate synthase